MASFTETVEARNPALTATGLAIWGWIQRVVVFASFLVIPIVINSVTPLVTYGATVSAYATKYKTEFAFAQSHPKIVQIASNDKTLIANATKFAPVLAVMKAHPAPYTQLIGIINPADAPPALIRQAIAAAGGGAQGQAILNTFEANKAAIVAVAVAAPQLQKLAPYAAQLTALSKIPAPVIAFMTAHAADVQKAAAETAGQWRNWWWVCFGGTIFFLLSIPLLKGRWRPSDARRDEADHEALVAAEMEKMHISA